MESRRIDGRTTLLTSVVPVLGVTRHRMHAVESPQPLRNRLCHRLVSRIVIKAPRAFLNTQSPCCCTVRDPALELPGSIDLRVPGNCPLHRPKIHKVVTTDSPH
jgi:hypothetical protein